MIFDLPTGLKGLEYYQGLSLIFWCVAIGLLFLGFVLFLLKGKKMEMKSQKMILNAYSVFALTFALTRIFFILGVYYADTCDDCYDSYTNIGYITGIIGLIFWLYVLESQMVKKTKMFFSIISIITFAISLIALIGATTRYIALTIIWILLPFSLGAIGLLYIYLIIKTTGTVRKKAEWLFIGLFLIIFGHIMDSEFFVSSFPDLPLIIAPLVMIAGMFIMLIMQLRD